MDLKEKLIAGFQYLQFLDVLIRSALSLLSLATNGGRYSEGHDSHHQVILTAVKFKDEHLKSPEAAST